MSEDGSFRTASPTRGAIVMVHRGHEPSGPMAHRVDGLGESGIVTVRVAQRKADRPQPLVRSEAKTDRDVLPRCQGASAPLRRQGGLLAARVGLAVAAALL